jgi:hypothetical protein
MTERKRPARWRRGENSYRFGPDTYRLYRGDDCLVTAQKCRDNSWFWYGLGVNTAGRSVPTLEDIKQQVTEYLASDAGRAALTEEKNRA